MRIKRLQRAGLPLYPPEVCLQVLNGSQESHCMDTLLTGDTHGTDLIQTDHFEIPDVEFKNLEFSKGVLSFSTTLVDIPSSNMLKENVDSSHRNTIVFPTIHPLKHPRESETIFPCPDYSGLPEFNQLSDYAYERTLEPLGLSCLYDSDVYEQPPSAVLSGSHALLNGSSSSSEPISGPMKLELPSLQYSETQQDKWGTCSFMLPLLESVDTLLQSPPTEQTLSGCLSPRSNGLLEAVLYESQSLKNLKNVSVRQISDTSVTPDDLVHASILDYCGTKWEAHADLNSPIGHSTGSLLGDCTLNSGITSDEWGCDVKPEVVGQVLASYAEDKVVPNCLDFTRPDVLLGSGWSLKNGHDNDQCFGALLGEDNGKRC
uniref:Transcription factor GAMYB-like n=1 Tax=Rhizophora mucronata TaxID=61149 RepID=A0A2P2IHG5_RHIMU